MRGAPCVLLLFLCSLALPVSAAIFFGPTPYRSQADIPAGFYTSGVPDGLEDFEDRDLDFGITASVGSVKIPSTFTDSVDADDGAIDGLGQAGNSWVIFGNEVSFTFPAPVTAAGIVFTDAYPTATTSFQAFDATGASLGTIGPFSITDSSTAGTTIDDHFFGIQHAAGIQKIRVIITVAFANQGLEVDHVQFGSSLPVTTDEGTWGGIKALYR